jgi:hypothetical protein
MWNGFVGQRIAGSAKWYMWLGIVSVVVALVIAAAWAKTTLNLIHGPVRLNESALGAMSAPSLVSQDYVTVQGHDPTPTGITEETTRSENGVVKSKTTTAGYTLLIMGKRALLVKARPGDNATTYTGTIVAIPDDIKASLNSGLADDPGVQAAILPVMLDASQDYGDGVWAAGFFAVGFVVWGSWALFRSKKFKDSPETHPICKGLLQYGPLYAIVPEIDAEITDAVAIRGVVLTRNWIISRSTTMRRAEIVWVYKKRTRHSVNFIPTGSTYAMVVRDSRGKAVEINNAEQAVDSQLGGWAAQMPWVIFGFNKQLEKLYLQQRPAFAQTVSERRASLAVSKSA